MFRRNVILYRRLINQMFQSFNTKIKNFRLQLRGVTDRKSFLFRLAKLFAYSPTFETDPKLF
ncbi:hypothetical protein FCL53_06165 [Elizabethkingia meningoseptica]|nr:hypothetical protein [Elizabethkingia meningoseptica]